MAVFALPKCCTPTLIARIATVFCTVSWAVLVLLTRDALNPMRYAIYDNMLAVMREDLWGAGALVISSVGAFGWFTRINRWLESAVYGSLCMFQLYLTASLFFWYQSFPPTGTPAILTVCGLSIFAFVSHERRNGPKPL